MNKTISVNIGGRVFNIEEDAYEKLNAYLKAIRASFAGSPSAGEIVSDIELRIAELFIERTEGQKEAITMSDVEDVIKIMGQPEDYLDEEEQSQGSAHRYRSTDSNKRVYRDPDNKVLFGTCSGISAYFGWDPIVLRALFAILFIFFGTGLLIYIILSIIIPKANTTAEKLAMHGEPVTVDNISRKVSESFEDVKQDIKDFGKKNNINEGTFNGFMEEVGRVVRSVANFLIKILSLLFTAIGKVLGLILFVLGICGIIFLVSAIFGWEAAFKYSTNGVYIEDQLQMLIDASFANPTLKILGIISISLLAAIPFVGALLLGIRLLFDYRKIPGYVGVTLITLWFISLGMAVAVAGSLSQEFRMEASYDEDVEIALPNSDTLYIDLINDPSTKYKFTYNFDPDAFFSSGGVTIHGSDSTDIVYMRNTSFTIAENPSDTIFKLTLNRSANGRNQKDAMDNATAPRSEAIVKGDSLLIHPKFALPKGQKLRNQAVKYILEVPVGKSVHFNPGSRKVIYDVPNVTNTVDSKMIGKTWIMTPEGLKCTSEEANPNSDYTY